MIFQKLPLCYFTRPLFGSVRCASMISRTCRPAAALNLKMKLNTSLHNSFMDLDLVILGRRAFSLQAYAHKCNTKLSPSSTRLQLHSRICSARQTSILFRNKCNECVQLSILNLRVRHYSSSNETVMNVFDRKAKRKQRNKTALMENYELYDYIKDEIGYRTADKICDVKRKFDVAVELGCGRGHVAQHTYNDMIGTLYQTDMAELVLAQSKVSPEVPTYKIHADEEFLPFPNNSLDLVISSLSLHWVNDLPGTFRQVFTALKKDGCFIGAMFGGDTLFQLRTSLQQAETEREAGFAPHISPFTSAQDLGGLLNRTGYVMLTIDVDELTVNYPTMFELMNDLKGMGESNCAWSRPSMIKRDTLMAAAAIYNDMYSIPDQEGIPATFQILNFIAWKPHPSQIEPAQRGSGQISFKDIHKADELTKQLQDAKPSEEGTKSAVDWDPTFDKLSKDIEKLRKATVEQSINESDDSEKDKT